MQPKGRRPAAKKKRVRHAERIRKYTPEERREREKQSHGPVERERFEQVIRALVQSGAPPKR
jgi:hypothetical protein